MAKLQIILGILIAILVACQQQPKEAAFVDHSRRTAAENYSRKEAPMLAELVDAGKLPPLEQRLPQSPKVVVPRETVGHYCSEWRMGGNGTTFIMGCIARYSYVSLLHWSMDWDSWEPGVAERFEVLDGGRRFRFHLRPGHRWSDGMPFTTRDIEFSLNDVLLNPKIHPNPPRFLIQGKNHVRTKRLNDTTIDFIFPEPNGSFLLDITANGDWLLLPAHYLRRFLPPHISEARADSMANANSFSAWTHYFSQVLQSASANPELPTLRPWLRKTPRGEEANGFELERNPYYYVVDPAGQQLPYFDCIVVRNVNNDETLILHTITGGVDMQIRGYADRKHARLLLENQDKAGYTVQFYPRTYPLGIFINQQKKDDPIGRKLNSNPVFRLALSLAINREEINKLLDWGEGANLYEMVIAPQYRDDTSLKEWFRFDPVRSAFLLDSLGLKVGNDGIRRRPDGKPLAPVIFSNSTMPFDYLELIQEYWAAIGVKLNINIKTNRSWWEFTTAGKFDMVAYVFMGVADREIIIQPSHLMPIFTGTYWAPEWGTWYQSEGENGIEPPDYIKNLYQLHADISAELDPVHQKQMLEQLSYESMKIGHTLVVKARMPQMVVIRDGFHNVSDGNRPKGSWIRRSPAPDFPETYFMD
ncbi:hypothetical protein KAH55_12090 [bacterium]|nr:hypothetical protein [bacterium]